METRRQLTVVSNAQGTPVELRRGSLISFGPRRTNVAIEVCKGDLWITAQNDPNDRLLHAGDSGVLNGRNLVAQALSDARICVA